MWCRVVRFLSLAKVVPHPDDHTTRSTVTHGFKPFTVLRSLGRQSERLANNYITYASTVRRIRQQLWFNHRCKDHGLVPAGLKLKSPLNTQEEAIQIVKSTCRRLVKARINDCHRRLNYYNNNLKNLNNWYRLTYLTLLRLLPTNEPTKRLNASVLDTNKNWHDFYATKRRNDGLNRATTGSGISLPVP